MRKNGEEKRKERPSAKAAVKTSLVLILSACLAISLIGCGAATQPAASPFSLDVAEAGERLYDGLVFRETLEELPPEILYVLLGIDESDVLGQKNYFSSGATAEEIIVFQGVNAEAAARLEAVLAERIQEQKDIYAAYGPQEVVYLQGAVLLTKGDYVLYCVASGGEEAQALAKEILAD